MSSEAFQRRAKFLQTHLLLLKKAMRSHTFYIVADQLAKEMKKLGIYSKTTYTGDIVTFIGRWVDKQGDPSAPLSYISEPADDLN